MSPKLDKALCEKYPTIFADRYGSARETAMCWGFDCGDGWYKIIDELCEDLLTVPGGSEIRAAQVKEKFGTLRFYTNGYNRVIEKLIRHAEHESASTCEDCGRYGKVRGHGWLQTLCDAHAKEDGHE